MIAESAVSSASSINSTLYESKIYTLLYELVLLRLGSDIDREILVLVDPVYPAPKIAFPLIYQNGTMLGETEGVVLDPTRLATRYNKLPRNIVVVAHKPHTCAHVGGIRGIVPKLDCGLTLNMLGSGSQGTIILRDLAIFNLPPSRASYPVGMLTALPWFIYLNRCARGHHVNQMH